LKLPPVNLRYSKTFVSFCAPNNAPDLVFRIDDSQKFRTRASADVDASAMCEKRERAAGGAERRGWWCEGDGSAQNTRSYLMKQPTSDNYCNEIIWKLSGRRACAHGCANARLTRATVHVSLVTSENSSADIARANAREIHAISRI